MPPVSSLMRASSAARRSGVAKLPPSSLARPDHVGERTGSSNHLLDRAAPAGPREIVGVLPLRQQRETKTLAGCEERQGKIGCAIRRLLAGTVAVEAEDRLVRHLPEQRELALGERGAERRDAACKARGDHGDDVDIAFDHDQRAAVMGGLAGSLVVVEVVALVEERRLRRV